MKKLPKSSWGFTIVELIVVIAILAALAGILVPSMASYAQTSKFSAANADAKTAFNAAAMFITETRIGDEEILLSYSANGTRPGSDEMAQSLWDLMVDITKCSNPCYTMYLSNTKDVPVQLFFSSSVNDQYIGGFPTGNKIKGKFSELTISWTIEDGGALYDDAIFTVTKS